MTRSRSRTTGIASWPSRLPLFKDHSLVAIGAAIAVIAIAFALRIMLNASLPPGFPYLTFFPAIVLIAFLFGARSASVAAVLGFFLSWYFFIAPVRSFSLTVGAAVALSFYVFIVTVNIALIHWMQQANANLKKSREENRKLADHREALFRELQHRVGNNLQMVSAMLSLQKAKMSHTEGRDAFSDAARRVGLIGRIQRQLYHPDGATIGLRAYLADIVSGLIEQSGRTDITSSVEGDQTLTLKPDQAIPTALIVSESIANALEHGLTDSAGTIRIDIARDAGTISIRVSDTGQKLASELDPATFSSLGLRLASAFARQMGGSYRLYPEAGQTVAHLELPAN